VQSAPRATTREPRPSPDDLAKAWLVGVVQRTPLDRVTDLDLDLLTTAAGPLIAGILDGLHPGAHGAPDLPPRVRERARDLGRLRRGQAASAEILRDLGVLQSVLIAALLGDAPDRQAGDLERSVQRLAEVFGSVQGAVAEGILRDRTARRDELTALPGSADLEHWLEVLVAEYRRYGHPFALALVDVEGLGPINEAYGRQSGDRMLTALATVIRNQIRIVDHAFRLGDDEFCVVAPNVDAGRLRPMADRLARVVETSQSADAPRIEISVGVSACPEHGHDGGLLLQVAERALDTAREAGQPVEVAASNGHRLPRIA
jgi:diguanylate cyclase (GGDEF)-like protein